MKRFNLLYVFSLLMAFSLVSCSGEDGADGADGADGDPGAPGLNGTNGTDGTDGTDGENGVGFDELTKYGHLTMVLEGTRPDGVEFRDSTAFKFTPMDGGGLPYVNGLTVTEGEITNHRFDIQRFLSSPDDFYQENYLAFNNLSIVDLGGDNEEIVDVALNIESYAVIGEDNKYFVIDDYFFPDSEGVSDFEITDIAFDAETNHLTFSYTLNVNADNNDSGNDLSISGTADVYVLEEIDSDA
ncbi:MAG: hypothetical protein AB3N18_15135 [Allomuricauda sp.]